MSLRERAPHRYFVLTCRVALDNECERDNCEHDRVLDKNDRLGVICLIWKIISIYKWTIYIIK